MACITLKCLHLVPESKVSQGGVEVGGLVEARGGNLQQLWPASVLQMCPGGSGSVHLPSLMLLSGTGSPSAHCVAAKGKE